MKSFCFKQKKITFALSKIKRTYLLKYTNDEKDISAICKEEAQQTRFPRKNGNR